MRTTLLRGVAHFSYTPLLALAAAVSFGKLVVYAQLIGVSQFGVLGKMLLVSTVFGMVGSWGMQSVAGRDLPALIAQGRERRGVRLLGQTIAVATWSGLACLVLAVLGASVFDLSTQELAIGVAHGWAQLVFLTAAFESRSRLHMMRYARDMAARSVTIAVAGIGAGVLGCGASGVMVVELAGTLLFFAWLLRSSVLRYASDAGLVRRVFALHRWVPPWRSAGMMFLGSVVMFGSANLDRWLAAEVLPHTVFGVYSFAWLAILAAQSVQFLLNSGLMPLLAHRHMETSGAGTYRLTSLVSGALLVTGFLFVLPAAWFLAAIAEHLMPQYVAAQPLWLPLLLAAVFRVADFWSSLLLVIKQEGRLLAVQLVALVGAGLGYVIWLVAGGGNATPVSLAWFAASAAALSHAASAVMATHMLLARSTITS